MNDDTQCDLYTPLLFKEKGLKRQKEQYRQLNKIIRHASTKANEIGSQVISQTEQIRKAMSQFVGDMNTFNKIGHKINQTMDDINCKISGIKRMPKNVSQEGSDFKDCENKDKINQLTGKEEQIEDNKLDKTDNIDLELPRNLMKSQSSTVPSAHVS